MTAELLHASLGHIKYRMINNDKKSMISAKSLQKQVSFDNCSWFRQQKVYEDKPYYQLNDKKRRHV